MIRTMIIIVMIITRVIVIMMIVINKHMNMLISQERSPGATSRGRRQVERALHDLVPSA